MPEVRVYPVRDGAKISSFRLEFPEPTPTARVTALILHLKFRYHVTDFERPDPIDQERSLTCTLKSGHRLEPNVLSAVLAHFSFTISEPSRSALAA